MTRHKGVEPEGQPGFRYKLLKRLVLVLLPAGIIEVFVKDDNGTGSNSVRKRVEHKSGRRVKIAVDVQQSDPVIRGLHVRRKRVGEPSLMQRHMVRNGR